VRLMMNAAVAGITVRLDGRCCKNNANTDIDHVLNNRASYMQTEYAFYLPRANEVLVTHIYTVTWE
jgi:hypothetical protein